MGFAILSKDNSFADALSQVGCFMSEKKGDCFKLVSVITSLFISMLDDLDPELVRHLSHIGKTARTMADGFEVTDLPRKVFKVLTKGDLISVAGLVDNVAKAAKFLHGTKVLKIGALLGRFQTGQNLAGLALCTKSAYEDMSEWLVLGNKSPLPENPECMHQAHENKRWAKFLGVTKNVARVALNALAFSGAVFGIVTWSPIMLSLVTVGLFSSIAGFFFKKNAELALQQGFKKQLDAMSNAALSVKDRFNAAAALVQIPLFAKDQEAKEKVGNFLDTVIEERRLGDVYKAAVEANGGGGKEGIADEVYGPLAISRGLHMDDKRVRAAIVAASIRYTR